MAIFQELNRSGITVVLVTHEPDIAQFARRILSFRDGQLTGDTPVAEPREADRVLAALPAEAVP
jgi:putative ABC transport system ATP-binding protein